MSSRTAYSARGESAKNSKLDRTVVMRATLSNNLRCLGVAETLKLIVLRPVIEEFRGIENPSVQ